MQFGSQITRLLAVEELEHGGDLGDLVVGAVLVTGRAAPKLGQRELVTRMRTGS